MDCDCISSEEMPLFVVRGQPASFHVAPVQPPNKIYEFIADEVSNFWFALHGRLLDWAKLMPLVGMDPVRLRVITRGQHQHRWVLHRLLNDAATRTSPYWRADFYELDSVPQLSVILAEIEEVHDRSKPQILVLASRTLRFATKALATHAS